MLKKEDRRVVESAENLGLQKWKNVTDEIPLEMCWAIHLFTLTEKIGQKGEKRFK